MVAVNNVELEGAARQLLGEAGAGGPGDVWILLDDRGTQVVQHLETEWDIRGIFSSVAWGESAKPTDVTLDLPWGSVRVVVHGFDDETGCLDFDRCPFHLDGNARPFYQVPHLERTVVEAARQLSTTKELHLKNFSMHLSCLKLLVAVTLVYLDLYAARSHVQQPRRSRYCPMTSPSLS
jgi:hypothetical protein